LPPALDSAFMAATGVEKAVGGRVYRDARCAEVGIRIWAGGDRRSGNRSATSRSNADDVDADVHRTGAVPVRQLPGRGACRRPLSAASDLQGGAVLRGQGPLMGRVLSIFNSTLVQMGPIFSIQKSVPYRPRIFMGPNFWDRSLLQMGPSNACARHQGLSRR
jgi:hypothetical protein